MFSRSTFRTIGTILIVQAVLIAIGFTAFTAVTAPPTEVNADSVEGNTLVGTQGAPSPGRVVMLSETGDVLWEEKKADSYHDVTLLDNGSVLATPTTAGHENCGPYEAPCPRTGIKIIDPKPSPHTVYNWTFPIRTYGHSEVHDAEQLPNGNFVIVDMEYERIFILEPSGNIVWQWNASNFYNAPDDATKRDWLHMNDVDRIGEGKFLVSVRNANQLLIVDRGEGVVEVVNKDTDDSNDSNCMKKHQLDNYEGEDVKCGDPSVINHQHNPQYLGDGRILVADSDNHRVVELHKQNNSWNVVWSKDSAGGLAFDWPRDADRLENGNTLITDSRNHRIVEIAPNGTVVWSASVPGLPYEADRLPTGERLKNTTQSTITGSDEEDHAVSRSVVPEPFRMAYAGLTHVLPVPYWVSEYHVIVATYSLLTLLGGVILRRFD